MRLNLTNPLMVLTVSSALTLIAACAPPPATNTGQSVDKLLSSPPPTLVMVRNQQAADMKVYVVAGSAEHRLGLVSAASTVTFRLPGVILTPADVRLLAVPLGAGESHATDLVTVNAGNYMVFTIGQTQAMSNLVWRR